MNWLKLIDNVNSEEILNIFMDITEEIASKHFSVKGIKSDNLRFNSRNKFPREVRLLFRNKKKLTEKIMNSKSSGQS